ncbi:response regulator [Ferruginibacter sp.]
MTVLIVESSLLISGRMRNLLLESAHAKAVHQSVSHNKAELIFEEIKPQVVLIDTSLPGRTSIDLLKKIKQAAVPAAVIALVNREDSQKQMKCTAAGADFILDKYHEFEKIPGILDTIKSKRNNTASGDAPKHQPEIA